MAAKSNANKKRKELASSSPWEPEEGEATAEEGKSIYLFFSHGWGPIAHSLYAVDLPHPPLLPADPEESKLLRPILELPREQYPSGMDCVELDSKFYFIGGRFGERCPRNDFGVMSNVYIFNPNHHGSEARLLEGPKMKTAKVKPVVFVVDRKIYVLSGLEPDLFRGKLSLFECFDPRVGKWFQLKPPPFRSFINCHTVINRKVFILTEEDSKIYGRRRQLCCFDLDRNEWFAVLGCCPTFYRRAEFVDDTLYCCYLGGAVVSCGPLDPSSGSEEEEELFRKKFAFLMPNVIHPTFPTSLTSNSLRHIGNRCLCYVGSCSNSAPTDPEEVHYIGLTVFEALKETYTVRDRSFFKANLLHSASFHIITCECSMTDLVDCFAIP